MRNKMKNKKREIKKETTRINKTGAEMWQYSNVLARNLWTKDPGGRTVRRVTKESDITE